MVIVLSFSHIYVMQPILPVVAHDLGASVPAASALMTGTLLALAASNSFWGALADRIGRRRVMIVGATLLAIPSAAMPFAPNLGVLVALRVAQGALVPAVTVAAAAYAHEERRGSSGAAMAVFVGATAYGGLLGRVASGVLTEWIGWRASFWVHAGGTLLGALLIATALPTSTGFTPRQQSGGAAALRHLRNPQLVAVFLAGALSYAALSGISTYMPYRLAAAPFLLGPATIGAVYVAYGTGGLTTVVGGSIVARMGTYWGLSAGLVGCAAAIVITLTPSVPLIILGFTLLLMAYLLIQVAVTTLITDAAAGARAGAVSLYYAVYYLFGAAGATGPAWMWQNWQWSGVTTFSLVMLGAAAVAAGFLRRGISRTGTP